MSPIVIDVESIGIEDVSTYLEPVKAPDNYKRPEAIAAYESDERAKQIEKAGLDCDLARIVCLGIHVPGQTTETFSLKDYPEEHILKRMWQRWQEYEGVDRRLVTYNGLSFDIPLLLRRSLYLGVPVPFIQLDKFRHPAVVDLMLVLNMDGKLRSRGLQFYLNRFGYTGGGPDITGADIAARYAAGDWAAIEQHCRMDVEATAWLAERIGAIPKQPAVGQAREYFEQVATQKGAF